MTLEPAPVAIHSNPLRDYLARLLADPGRDPGVREHMQRLTQPLLKQFTGADPLELVRLRCALELYETACDRSQSWEARGPALKAAESIFRSLKLVQTRHRGGTVAPKRRQPKSSLYLEEPESAGGAE